MTRDPGRRRVHKLVPSAPPKQTASHCASLTKTMTTASVAGVTASERHDGGPAAVASAFLPEATLSSKKSDARCDALSYPTTVAMAEERRRERAIPPPIAPMPITVVFIFRREMSDLVLHACTVVRAYYTYE